MHFSTCKFTVQGGELLYGARSASPLTIVRPNRCSSQKEAQMSGDFRMPILFRNCRPIRQRNLVFSPAWRSSLCEATSRVFRALFKALCERHGFRCSTLPNRGRNVGSAPWPKTADVHVREDRMRRVVYERNIEPAEISLYERVPSIGFSPKASPGSKHLHEITKRNAEENEKLKRNLANQKCAQRKFVGRGGSKICPSLLNSQHASALI